MDADLSKLCADYLRANIVSQEKFKASHARELVAAYFGYKSHAAQLAEVHHPLSALGEATTIIPDVALIELRRQTLERLPNDLPRSRELAASLSQFLLDSWGFPGNIWVYDFLEDCITCELLDGLENDEDVCEAMSMTNAGYGEPFYFDDFKIEDRADVLVVTLKGELIGEPHDNDRSFSGSVIGVKVQVTFPRIAGKRGFDEPEIELLECGVTNNPDEDDPYGERYIWERAKEIVTEELIRCAKIGKTVSYSYLTEHVLEPALRADYKAYQFPPLTYHDTRLFYLLGQISTDEVNDSRPPLSAVVTLKEDPNRCGADFYNLCEELEIFVRNPARKKADDEFMFWAKTMKDLKDHWSRIS